MNHFTNCECSSRQDVEEQLVNKPITISVNEFCRISSLGRTSAFAVLASGAVRSRLVGRRRLVDMASAEAYLKAGKSGEAEI
jgi:hypothetical protein